MAHPKAKPSSKRMPSDYGIIETDESYGNELMAEIQKGVDSIDAGRTYPAEEVFKEVGIGARKP